MKKKAILLVAFGSGSPQGESTLRRVRNRVHARFPNISVRLAFTSLLMCRRLAEARKKTDSVAKALRKLHFERYTHVAVQSLHAIPGAEYSGLVNEVQSAQTYFDQISLGAPLLAYEADLLPAAKALLNHIPKSRQAHEHVIFMGHGTKHMAHAHYEAFAACVNVLDSRVHIGTMDGDYELAGILPKLAEAYGHEDAACDMAASLAQGSPVLVTGTQSQAPAQRVWLMPLLSVVGHHATQDMAGQGADSWRARIEAEGYICKPILRGIADSADFVELWLDNLAVALERLDCADSAGCAGSTGCTDSADSTGSGLVQI
ncbi:MAG: sirohydrochlorin cobaltochelatase [Pseudomonadota bacterium]